MPTSITIYGQHGGTGKLLVRNKWSYGIYASSITINGGIIDIHTDGEANGSHAAIQSRWDTDSGITFNGGQAHLSASNHHGIDCTNINLNYRSTSDCFYTDGYYYYQSSTLTFANGKAFTDEDGNIYSGTYTFQYDYNFGCSTPFDGMTLQPFKWRGCGTETDPYQIATTTELDLLALLVNSGTDYSGKYFKVTADIAYSTEGLSETESNYAAIGGYCDETERFFCGHFDGGGHTISGIRIYTPHPPSSATQTPDTVSSVAIMLLPAS